MQSSPGDGSRSSAASRSASSLEARMDFSWSARRAETGLAGRRCRQPRRARWPRPCWQRAPAVPWGRGSYLRIDRRAAASLCLELSERRFWSARAIVITASTGAGVNVVGFARLRETGLDRFLALHASQCRPGAAGRVVTRPREALGAGRGRRHAPRMAMAAAALGQP